MLASKVYETVTGHMMVKPRDKVLLAVSGGPDSMALLHIMDRLSERLGIELHVFHLDHMFRGDESLQDAVTVEEYCSRLGIPCTIERYDVPALIDRSGMSPQDAARAVRYQLAAATAAAQRCASIALAHHRDDQLETVIMRFLRGAGLNGLAGIRPIRVWHDPVWDGLLIRPLIRCARREIEEYCIQHRIPSRTDRTNLTTKYERNRIRLELIPELKTYNPGLAETICGMSQVFADEDDYLDHVADDAIARISKRSRGCGEAGASSGGNHTVSMAVNELECLHIAVRRRVIFHAISMVKGGSADIYAKHVEDVLQLISNGEHGGTLTLPGGVIVRKRYGMLDFGSEAVMLASPVGRFEIELRIPGITVIPELRRVITAAMMDGTRAREELAEGRVGPCVCLLDYDRLVQPVVVRNRRDGDRLVPLGMSGRKKLKELFIDLKVPAEVRDRIPLIVHGQTGSDVAWVVGYRVSETTKITEQTARALRLACTDL